MIAEVGLSRRVWIALLVLLALSALPALLFAPIGVGISVLALAAVIKTYLLSIRDAPQTVPQIRRHLSDMRP